MRACYAICAAQSCRSVLHGAAGGVQVIDRSNELDVRNKDDLVLTSRVTTRLRHPCIVRTIAHCVTEAPSSKPWDSAHSAPSKSSAKRDACWMMLEYCDKGTLQVRPSHALLQPTCSAGGALSLSKLYECCCNTAARAPCRSALLAASLSSLAAMTPVEATSVKSPPCRSTLLAPLHSAR